MSTHNYICRECGEMFDTPETLVNRWVVEQPPFRKENICPSCGSVAFEEAEECSGCGDEFPASELVSYLGSKLCPRCLSIAEAVGYKEDENNGQD